MSHVTRHTSHLLGHRDVGRRELDGEGGATGDPQTVGGLVVQTVAGALTGILNIVSLSV